MKDNTSFLPKISINDKVDGNCSKERFGNPSSFEAIFTKIHAARRSGMGNHDRQRSLEFLHRAYDITQDVRYYNEFLWLYTASPENDKIKESCDRLFMTNLNDRNQHCHKFNSDEIQLLTKGNNRNPKINDVEGISVCLIGFPMFFGPIQLALQKWGANVSQIFIPKHPNKPINLLLQSRLLVKLISLISKNPYSYRTLRDQNDKSNIYEDLRSQNFEVGFHKLNFIIRENIFRPFKRGLINDHWGALPYLRGRSTLAYSLLLGMPIVATTHLVEKGIDTGKIINYYEYNIDELKSLNEIRTMVKRDLTRRAVESVQVLCSDNFQPLVNDLSKGLTFYEIHPTLYKFIETKILKNR